MKIQLLKRIQIEAVLPYLGFAVFILIIKIVLIALYGNATPYWDQWDAEADHLYRPWLEGSLQWMDLFISHNEHRILTTRLLALGLLELNGRIWNPTLQMQVNATIHTTALLVLLLYLSRTLPISYKSSLFIFSAVLFSIPFGWENILVGFQSQFYFLLIFSFTFLWAMSVYKTYSIKWWLGVIAGILCPLSLASGTLTLLAGSLVLAVKRVVAKDKDSTAISAIILIMVMAFLSISLTPSIPEHTALKAQSLAQFMSALIKLISWPDQKVGIGFFIIQAPIFLFIFMIFHNRKYHVPYLFIVAMTIWLYGQFLSIAYGRAIFALAPRYLDIFAVGLVLNYSAFMHLMCTTTQHKILYRVGIIIWLTVIIYGFFMSIDEIQSALHDRAYQGMEQQKNVRAYLCSGDITNLQNKPRLSVPYNNVERLKNLLDNKAIRSILPGNIYEGNSKWHVGADGEPYCDPGFLAHAFYIEKWVNPEDRTGFATTSSITANGWQGMDHFKSTISGFQVIGSVVHSEMDTGMVTFRLHRGERILYRSGPRVAGQFILIDGGGESKFYTTLPLALDWLVLVFSNHQLPNEFEVTLIDVGTKWGEWSAIALQSSATN